MWGVGVSRRRNPPPPHTHTQLRGEFSMFQDYVGGIPVGYGMSRSSNTIMMDTVIKGQGNDYNNIDDSNGMDYEMLVWGLEERWKNQNPHKMVRGSICLWIS